MTTERLEQAHERAQAAFHDMLENGTQADKDSPFTKAYVAAERVVDEILTDLQWEKTKAELDALIAADGPFRAHAEADARMDAAERDRDRTGDPDLSLGDHHVGVGR